jgi:hypothetical protein
METLKTSIDSMLRVVAGELINSNMRQRIWTNIAAIKKKNKKKKIVRHSAGVRGTDQIITMDLASLTSWVTMAMIES